MLWHGAEPIGICVFASPAASLKRRTEFFGLRDSRSPTMLQRINRSLWVLSRVVLHPAYRGAGIAADFVARACESCPVQWIETLSAMGRINPFFERAGFVKVGTVARGCRDGTAGSYAVNKGKIRLESIEKSRFSEPVYYIRRNGKCQT